MSNEDMNDPQWTSLWNKSWRKCYRGGELLKKLLSNIKLNFELRELELNLCMSNYLNEKLNQETTKVHKLTQAWWFLTVSPKRFSRQCLESGGQTKSSYLNQVRSRSGGSWSVPSPPLRPQGKQRLWLFSLFFFERTEVKATLFYWFSFFFLIFIRV